MGRTELLQGLRTMKFETLLDRWQRSELSQAGSCPIPWCSSDVVVVLFGRAGRLCQAAMTGNLTKGSSLIGAMVSRET